jgi:YidC/Oxa1 family membrane protein insertase
MNVWASYLAALRGALFIFSHLCGGSLGFGIIALSVTVRLALLPFTLRAARRSAALRERMKQLEPALAALKQEHATDPRRLREAMFEHYREAGVNPARDSGIATVLVQLPIGIGLYSVVRAGSAAAAPFLWIASLARPDVMLAGVVGGIAIAAGLTAPTTGTGHSSLLSFAMGAITFVTVLHLSAGVALYWASNSGVSLLQNALLRRPARA